MKKKIMFLTLMCLLNRGVFGADLSNAADVTDSKVFSVMQGATDKKKGNSTQSSEVKSAYCVYEPNRSIDFVDRKQEPSLSYDEINFLKKHSSEKSLDAEVMAIKAEIKKKITEIRNHLARYKQLAQAQAETAVPIDQDMLEKKTLHLKNQYESAIAEINKLEGILESEPSPFFPDKADDDLYKEDSDKK
jgi:hypothetical protein